MIGTNAGGLMGIGLKLSYCSLSRSYQFDPVAVDRMYGRNGLSQKRYWTWMILANTPSRCLT